MSLADQIARVVADADLGKASARKRGSNAAFPYVPVIERGERSQNPLRGLAYATREEAVAAAQRHLDALRDNLARQLAEPRYRALREHHGLPREINR